MNEALEKAWEQAEQRPGESIDIGRIVICDFCNDDHTESTVTGGLIFGSYALCPKCEHKVKGEKRGIKARCPEGVNFGDFVRNYRGGHNSISITPIKAPKCRDCKQPFSDSNTHTSAGWAETRISGMCEDCFDAMFEEDGE